MLLEDCATNLHYKPSTTTRRKQYDTGVLQGKGANYFIAK